MRMVRTFCLLIFGPQRHSQTPHKVHVNIIIEANKLASDPPLCMGPHGIFGLKV
jgi:hypothetical protein